MKSSYSTLLLLFSVCYTAYAQQEFSSFPIAIEKAEYDDREALFIPSHDNTTGMFVSDDSKMHFLMLGEDGQPLMDKTENMPSNYGSLKRAGAGTLGGDYMCYFLQTNKKVFAFKANATTKSLVYAQLPFNGNTILLLAAGKEFAYVVTTSDNSKDELMLYKYTSFTEPEALKIKTNEADFYKAFSINSSKSTEEIAVLPLNSTAHFDKTQATAKCYFDENKLIITSDEKDGNTKILTISSADGSSTLSTIKTNIITDKKTITKSVLFKNTLWQLVVTQTQFVISGTDIANNTLVYTSEKDERFDTEAYIESSYTFRSGYSRERKSTSKTSLIKTFQRSDISGIGIVESNNGKLLLVTGAINKNNLSDPSIENSEIVQTSSVNMIVIMERAFSDLHIPSYSSYQQSLLSFKKEIWMYNTWQLTPAGTSITRAMPEDLPALEEGLDMYFRDPQNHTAPAVWKQGDKFLFGYYNSKSHLYSLYAIAGRKSESNRR